MGIGTDFVDCSESVVDCSEVVSVWDESLDPPCECEAPTDEPDIPNVFKKWSTGVTSVVSFVAMAVSREDGVFT